ncbi:MAG: hypothetical protein ABFC94_12230 [Syntrophomonas sp.]
MATKYNWTTGPVSSGLTLENARVAVLNNSTYNQKVLIRLYDLGVSPKKKVYTETMYVDPSATVMANISVKEIELWEVQAITFSKRVQILVGGGEGNTNPVVNTVLHSQLVRL